MLLYPTAGHPRLPSCSFSKWSETQLRTCSALTEEFLFPETMEYSPSLVQLEKKEDPAAKFFSKLHSTQ